VTPPEYREAEYRQLASLHATGRYGPYEKELIHKDGSRVPVLLNGMCLNDSDGGMLIWSIVQDISARKVMERELSIAARTDRLTGLANRTALTERLVAAVREVKADPSRRFQPAVPGFRPIQAGQRQPRPPCRRPAAVNRPAPAAQSGRPISRRRCHRQCGRAPWRRRVRAAAVRCA
jgi:hypothetical protein